MAKAKKKYDVNMFYIRPEKGCAECGNRVRRCAWSPSYRRHKGNRKGGWICWQCY